MGCCSSDLAKGEQRLVPINVGDLVPSFALPTHDGGHFDSSACLKEKRFLVIRFTRGSWCPFCRRSLTQTQARLSDIEALGATIVSIAPEGAASQAQNATALGLSFPLLQDADNAVAKQFGVVHVNAPLAAIAHDIIAHNTYVDGNTGATVVGKAESPHPVTYVVDAASGRVIASDVDSVNTMMRMSVDEIIAAIQQPKRDAF